MAFVIPRTPITDRYASVYLLKRSITMQSRLNSYNLLMQLVMHAAQLFKICLRRSTVTLVFKHE
jgi:hypothetical protein